MTFGFSTNYANVRADVRAVRFGVRSVVNERMTRWIHRHFLWFLRGVLVDYLHAFGADVTSHHPLHCLSLNDVASATMKASGLQKPNVPASVQGIEHTMGYEDLPVRGLSPPFSCCMHQVMQRKTHSPDAATVRSLLQLLFQTC